MTRLQASTTALVCVLTTTACGSGAGTSTTSTTTTTTTPTPSSTPTTTLSAPTAVIVTNVNERTVGASKMSSSTQLQVSWTAPGGYTVDHYELAASEAVYGTKVTASATASPKTLTTLKAATTYSIVVTACADATCTRSGAATAAAGATSEEFWQLQGSGNSVTGLTKIVSDGNARISATRFGPEAGVNADRLQLYYGPTPTAGSLQMLATASTSARTDAASSSSYLSFVSLAGSTGIISPPSSTSLVTQVATGQGVPLSAALGGKVRLFFEASGSDGKTRILSLDSQDGYLGRDFNTGTSALCSTAADYQSGGCVPTIVIGVEGDGAFANSRVENARQFKVGYPILDDWRWGGQTGTFMVFTIGSVSGCSTTFANHGYAVWNGSKWVVQYDTAGCPKLFKGVQAMFPTHLGGARYRLTYGDPTILTGKLSTSGLPWLGPKKAIYADGASTATAAVDFEDWEAMSVGRNVNFLWPSGDLLDDTAEGYIDDFHFLSPTGAIGLQVMYLAITNGAISPIGASAVLLNP